ncbi:caffeine-induced death protein 2 [Polychytrium aggregatum]|uniref:caffeine-induced death protein 2 n=1 Tax=Polychytrium aggregatum TaxID=110093 RepID=UPI0022FE0CF3|nr:caffeine-induced death protein 2 [Polychytrium aggregatum]KAI9202061.1 caffeine-induced death protein 2 [Polychytrium aggregatum]
MDHRTSIQATAESLKHLDLAELCADVSYFKRVLKDLRRIDDNIINSLNSLTSRSSNVAESCSQIHSVLVEAYQQRSSLITKCHSLSQEATAQRSQYAAEHPSDKHAQDAYRLAKTNEQHIKYELNVEEIVRDRTADVFKTRCRSSIKIPLINA